MSRESVQGIAGQDDNATAGVAVSRWSGGASARGESLVWTRGYFREESEHLRTVPRWRNYRLQAALLLALTACVVAIFR